MHDFKKESGIIHVARYPVHSLIFADWNLDLLQEAEKNKVNYWVTWGYLCKSSGYVPDNKGKLLSKYPASRLVPRRFSCLMGRFKRVRAASRKGRNKNGKQFLFLPKRLCVHYYLPRFHRWRLGTSLAKRGEKPLRAILRATVCFSIEHACLRDAYVKIKRHMVSLSLVL